MKTNARKLVITLLIALIAVGGYAQEFKKKVNKDATLKINRLVEDIYFTGYDGDEIIVSVDDYSKPPKRADGLKSLYNEKEDNTGIGLVMIQQGNVIEFQPATKQAEDAEYTFKVPNDIFLKIDFHHPMAEDVHVSDFGGEIDVKTLNGDITLENVFGPLVIYAINGDVDIDFTTVNQELPTSVEAINGEVNIKMPSSTKADLYMKTIHGEVFTNFDIKLKEKENEDDLHHIGGMEFKGEINGGGVKLNFSSINDNIYIRKK